MRLLQRVSKRGSRSFRLLLFAAVIIGLAVSLHAAAGLSDGDVFRDAVAAQFYREGEDYQSQGDFGEAVRCFRFCREYSRDGRNHAGECLSLLKMGLMYWNEDDIPASRRSYIEALNLARQWDLDDPFRESQIALGILSWYSESIKMAGQGDYLQAKEALEKSLRMAVEMQSGPHELKCLRRLSLVHRDVDNLERFGELNEAALKIARNLNHRKETERCLLNLASYHEENDHFSKSLHIYAQVLELAEGGNNIGNVSLCLRSMGAIYRRLGRYEKALDFFNRALETVKRNENLDMASALLNDLGLTRRLRARNDSGPGELRKALDYFKESLTIAESNGNDPTAIRVMGHIGSLYAELEDEAAALGYLREGLIRAQAVSDREAEAMILIETGRLLARRDRLKEAQDCLERAMVRASEIGAGRLLWESGYECARVLEKRNNPLEALRKYEQAIDIIESIRSWINLDELKVSYFGSHIRMDVYHHFISLLASLHAREPLKGYDRTAFTYLEKAKARSFLDELEMARVESIRGIDFKLRNREKRLLKNISGLNTRLLSPAISVGERTRSLEELENMESELEELKREMRTKSLPSASFTYQDSLSLTRVQRRLCDRRTAFLVYMVGDDRSYAFVISKRAFHVIPILPREALNDRVAEYMRIVNDKDNRDFTSGYLLYRQLILPVRRVLDDKVENLIIIPDDSLHHLPFESLITETSPLRWMIEDFNISYASSVTAYHEMSARKPKRGPRRTRDLLAFGDPSFGPFRQSPSWISFEDPWEPEGKSGFERLVHSGWELRRIGALFKPRKLEIRTREEASEERLKREPLDDFKILHFATHSVIDNEIPARSAVVLSLDEDPAEDGFLQMREIFGLKLRADLVTLSSCSSGLGKFTRGEGVAGLTRAFFAAGASAVMMSLWEVNDQATSQLMERFYTHLHSSLSISTALRRAQLEMAASDAAWHPYYWAGFVVSGKADQRVFPRIPNPGWLIPGILIVMLAAGLGGRAILRIRRRPGWK